MLAHLPARIAWLPLAAWIITFLGCFLADGNGNDILYVILSIESMLWVLVSAWLHYKKMKLQAVLLFIAACLGIYSTLPSSLSWRTLLLDTRHRLLFFAKASRYENLAAGLRAKGIHHGEWPYGHQNANEFTLVYDSAIDTTEDYRKQYPDDCSINIHRIRKDFLVVDSFCF